MTTEQPPVLLKNDDSQRKSSVNHKSRAALTGRQKKTCVSESKAIQVIGISELVDTSKVIEIEKIDIDALPKRYLYRIIKRAFDIVGCVCALVVLAIPMLIIAIMIKIDSPGPVLFKQERLGKNGEPFKLIKYRSMYIDAEARGAQWAKDGDPRITKIGKRLRAAHLDELPQLFQVITGKLSLVGPRPERDIFYSEFEKHINGFSQRLIIKPGVSGLAQVSGGYDLKPAEKVLYDIEYIKNQSVLLDLKIILKTLAIVFTHDGAR